MAFCFVFYYIVCFRKKWAVIFFNFNVCMVIPIWTAIKIYRFNSINKCYVKSISIECVCSKNYSVQYFSSV